MLCYVFSKYVILRQVSHFHSLEKMTEKMKVFTIPHPIHFWIPMYLLFISLGQTPEADGMMTQQSRLCLGLLIS